MYAPFSGVGGIVYDKDAVYIDTGGSHFHAKTEEVCVLYYYGSFHIYICILYILLFAR